METRIRKLINARAQAIQGFNVDITMKRQCLFEYTLALHEVGLMTWDEVIKFNAKPRFYDEVVI